MTSDWYSEGEGEEVVVVVVEGIDDLSLGCDVDMDMDMDLDMDLDMDMDWDTSVDTKESFCEIVLSSFCSCFMGITFPRLWFLTCCWGW